MMSCIVWGCPNSTSTADPTVHYYVFPKHPVIAQQWIAASGWPPEDVDVNIARICSIHFSEDSYTTEVKLIEYITCYSKVLKYDAVPTLYLPLTTEIVIKGPNSQDDLEEMMVFAPDQETINQKTQPEPEIATKSKQDTVAIVQPVDVLDKYKHIQTKEQLSTLENCNKTLREKVLKVEQNLKRLRETLTKQMEAYKMKDLELSNRHHEYLRTKRAFLSLQQQRTLLSKVFSESQIKILSGKKKIYWSNDDMAVGYTIRHLSNKRCYMYLTKKLNVPLPAVSSIKRWMTLKNTERRKEVALAKKDESKDDEDINE